MRHLYLTLLLACLPLWSFGQVLVNEIQSSNNGTIQDEDGGNEDWIELFNAGAEAVDLSGYWLSDDYSNPQRWTFPQGVSIGAGETLLVWASGKNRRNPDAPLHTNFSIGAEGEEILLSSPTGILLDEAPPMALTAGLSWGRSPDGADNWVYFTDPTPGSHNTAAGYTDILAPPQFSVTGGFYQGPFDLTIHHPDPAATIVYTLDASIPSLDNFGGTSYQYKNQYPESPGDPQGTLLEGEFRSHNYSTAIPIEDRSPAANKVSSIATSFQRIPYYFPGQPTRKATVVRARAFKSGALPSPITTHTYFITPDGNSPHQLAVISLNAQEDDLFDYEKGIHVAGVRFDQWRTANPAASANGASGANWQMRGDDWEVPANLELFEPDIAGAGLNQAMGVRIHGGWSRAHRQKSLRLYARSDYGESRFNHQVFPDQADNRYTRLVLRNSGNDNDYTMFRDAAIQAVNGELRGVGTQAYRPTVVYLNGEYWGILNLRERLDQHYLARTYGIDPDNVDYLANNMEVDQGDAVHYQQTVNFIAANNLALEGNFEQVRTLIDTDNYMDYTIANIYANNRDWPGNNIDYWRLRTGQYLP